MTRGCGRAYGRHPEIRRLVCARRTNRRECAIAATHSDTRPVLRGLIARLDVDAFVVQVEGRANEMAAYRDFVRDAQGQTDRGRAAIKWNIELFVRWLGDGIAPSGADLQRLQALIQSRVREGMRIEDGLLVYRRTALAAWDALVASADAEERAALLAGADVFFEYINVVSDTFARAYAEPEDSAAAVAERQARQLLDRLLEGRPLDPDHNELAEALGFPLQPSYRPFVACLVNHQARDHAALADQLRKSGNLAVTEGRRVVGLLAAPLTRSSIGSAGELIVAEDGPTGRADVEGRLEDARDLLTLAQARGLRGIVRPEDHLADLLLTLAPRQSDRIVDRVYGPLRGEPELIATLEALAANDFDRSAAAASLPVHRNTLLYRANKIEERTGLRLSATPAQALVWLATLRRQ